MSPRDHGSEEKQREAQKLLTESAELRAGGNVESAAVAHARAERLLQEVVQANPSNQKARLTLVTAYMNSGQKNRAKDEAKLMYHGQTTGVKEDEFARRSPGRSPRKLEDSPRTGPTLFARRWHASIEEVKKQYPAEEWSAFWDGKAPNDPRKKKPAQLNRPRSPRRGQQQWHAPPPPTPSPQQTPDDRLRIRVPKGESYWQDDSIEEMEPDRLHVSGRRSRAIPEGDDEGYDRSCFDICCVERDREED